MLHKLRSITHGISRDVFLSSCSKGCERSGRRMLQKLRSLTHPTSRSFAYRRRECIQKVDDALFDLL